jgi:oligopeptide/dipeptide ABC transporter ATP-binding protein
VAGPLLRVRDLRVWFDTDAGPVKAVDGVGFDIERGETLALVGESGCGKSVTALSLLRLIPMPPGRIVSGEILLDGEDLIRAGDERIRRVRGAEIAMIFQEPMTSLNPVYTIGDQIVEAIALHRRVSPDEARALAVWSLRRVGIPDPERRVDEYPHQMSGGMRQRVMIAMALSCSPKILIADEPTTALDVTIQTQILDLLRDLQREFRGSVLLITHDLGVVAEMAHRVAVMYAGRIVETATATELFDRPRHPYTAGLLESAPRLDSGGATLHTIEGVVPDALRLPPGCAFHPRCTFAFERCRRDPPPPLEPCGGDGASSRCSACWFVRKNPDADLLSAGRGAVAVPGAGGGVR